MIRDLDESLREFVRRDILAGAGIEVAFDAPTKEWSTRQNNPTLNLYLYDIREDLQRREVQYEDRRNDQGIIVERVLPPRRFKLSYLATAWTQRPEDEHLILSAVIAAFIRSDALPPELLQGALAAQDEPVRVTVALPLPPERSISDVWSALGGELKASVDLVITVPFTTGRTIDVGAIVTEAPFLNARSGSGSVEQRRGDGVVAATRPENASATEEAVTRGREKVGRAVVVKALSPR
jgi:hypothetical protein